MRLSVTALTITFGILWGGAVLFFGLANLAFPSYGVECLRLMASAYPGFNASGTFGDVLVGTLYGIVDGAIGGVLFGWIYNFFVGRAARAAQ